MLRILVFVWAPASAWGMAPQQMFKKFGLDMRTVATIGDSTFFHTGINSLLDVIYNGSNIVTCILDNRVTAMTGHQDHPGSGYTLQGGITQEVSIASLVKGMGMKNVRTVNPRNLQEVRAALDWALQLDEPSVIITRWPCLLKTHSPRDIEEFGNYLAKCAVIEEKCVGCKNVSENRLSRFAFQQRGEKGTNRRCPVRRL